MKNMDQMVSLVNLTSKFTNKFFFKTCVFKFSHTLTTSEDILVTSCFRNFTTHFG
jgi:hypothetical protein